MSRLLTSGKIRSNHEKHNLFSLRNLQLTALEHCTETEGEKVSSQASSTASNGRLEWNLGDVTVWLQNPWRKVLGILKFGAATALSTNRLFELHFATFPDDLRKGTFITVFLGISGIA